MSLYLVFEHVHQDLASYLEKCPSPGLGQDRIKVSEDHKAARNFIVETFMSEAKRYQKSENDDQVACVIAC